MLLNLARPLHAHPTRRRKTAITPSQQHAYDARRFAELVGSAALTAMLPMDEVLRSGGQFGPVVPVAPDASAQDRLVGFIGRDPGWRA